MAFYESVTETHNDQPLNIPLALYHIIIYKALLK